MSFLTITGIIIFTIGVLLALKEKTRKASQLVIGAGIICVLAEQVMPLINMFGKSHNKIVIGIIIAGLCIYFAYIMYKFFTSAFNNEGTGKSNSD